MAGTGRLALSLLPPVLLLTDRRLHILPPGTGGLSRRRRAVSSIPPVVAQGRIVNSCMRLLTLPPHPLTVVEAKASSTVSMNMASLRHATRRSATASVRSRIAPFRTGRSTSRRPTARRLSPRASQRERDAAGHHPGVADLPVVGAVAGGHLRRRRRLPVQGPHQVQRGLAGRLPTRRSPHGVPQGRRDVERPAGTHLPASRGAGALDMRCRVVVARHKVRRDCMNGRSADGLAGFYASAPL